MITGQNVQKLDIFYIFASYLASTLKLFDKNNLALFYLIHFNFYKWFGCVTWKLWGSKRSPFLLLLGKSVVIQQFWTPNRWKLLVLAWLFNHLLEPLSHLLLDLQFLSLKREKVTPTPTVLTVGEPKNVGPNSFLPTKVLKVCWAQSQDRAP